MPRHTGTTRGASSSRGSGRGSGSRGSGAQGSAEERETKISKAMSYVLRHGAEKEGVRLDENGYANVAELLSWARLSTLSVTFAELKSIVDTNAKQRFALIPLPTPPPSPSLSTSPPFSPFPSTNNPSHHLIRATQGHSLPIASENLLAPILATDADCPREVVHGTYAPAWKAIQASGGLRPMGRTHVHFALAPVTPPSHSQLQPQPRTQTPTSVSNDAPPPSSSSSVTQAPEPVISGMRASATVLVWVDVRRSLAAGMRWWRSANGVVLTEGDHDGVVRLEWVCRVLVRGRGGEWGDAGWGVEGGGVGG